MAGPSPYTDDRSIADVAQLWRRIPPRLFIFDHNLNCYRPSSAAFDDHPNGSPMSVVLGDDILAAGRIPESALAGCVGFALATFSAGLARSKGQGVVRAPLPEEPSHAEVFGRKTDSVRRTLAKGSRWVIAPPIAPASS
jgi:hypothetical protein